MQTNGGETKGRVGMGPSGHCDKLKSSSTHSLSFSFCSGGDRWWKGVVVVRGGGGGGGGSEVHLVMLVLVIVENYLRRCW